jgi:hypothetical protein
MIEVEEHVELG